MSLMDAPLAEFKWDLILINTFKLLLSSPMSGLDQLEPTKYTHHKKETFPNPQIKHPEGRDELCLKQVLLPQRDNQIKLVKPLHGLIQS